MLFSLDPDGGDFTVLHDFSALVPLTGDSAGSNADGAAVVARLAVSGNLLYGVASAGGPGGAGTVFALDVSEPGLRTLHHFEPLAAGGVNARGAHPVAELLRVGDHLYGTTVAGGPGGTGVVFGIALPLSIDIAATPRADGAPDLVVTGRGGPFSTYTIQATGDLAAPVSWSPALTSPADASGRLIHTEFNQAAPRRFFRLLSNP